MFRVAQLKHDEKDTMALDFLPSQFGLVLVAARFVFPALHLRLSQSVFPSNLTSAMLADAFLRSTGSSWPL